MNIGVSQQTAGTGLTAEERGAAAQPKALNKTFNPHAKKEQMAKKIKTNPLVIIFLIIITNTSFATVINMPPEQPTIQAGIDAATSAVNIFFDFLSIQQNN